MHQIELEEQLTQLAQKYQWVYPHTLLRFQVQVTEHCNLNCKDCGHFAPLAEEEYLDVEEYERDCARLSELFDSEVWWIYFVGGEPLLHPRLTDILRISREAFHVGRLKLVTNGLLLPSMGEDFWDACRKYNIEIYPTKYPVTFDYDAWGKYAESKGVKYKIFHHGETVNTFFRGAVGLKGGSTVEHNWFHCTDANMCITLRNGRLYPCGRSAHIKHLKKYFDLDLHLSKRNSVDIYSVKSAEELMHKLNRPIPLCRYCTMSGYEEKWAISKKDRYEWIDFEWLPADIQYLREASNVYVYGTGGMGAKTVKRLKDLDIKVKAILTDCAEEISGSVLEVPVLEAQRFKAEDRQSVCLIALEEAQQRVAAGKIMESCGFKQIIPLYD